MTDTDFAPIPIDPAELSDDMLLRLLWVLNEPLEAYRPYRSSDAFYAVLDDQEAVDKAISLDRQAGLLLISAWRRGLIDVIEPGPYEVSTDG